MNGTLSILNILLYASYLKKKNKYNRYESTPNSHPSVTEVNAAPKICLAFSFFYFFPFLLLLYICVPISKIEHSFVCFQTVYKWHHMALVNLQCAVLPLQYAFRVYPC